MCLWGEKQLVYYVILSAREWKDPMKGIYNGTSWKCQRSAQEAREVAQRGL